MQKIGYILTLAMLVMAFAKKNKREVVFTNKAPKPIGPYSQAIKTDKHLYVSGQVAIKQDGNMDTSSIENECQQIMENIKAILESGGYSISQIVKTSIYTTRLSEFNTINKVYGSYFSQSPPARETIGVASLPKGARVEISVIAEK